MRTIKNGLILTYINIEVVLQNIEVDLQIQYLNEKTTFRTILSWFYTLKIGLAPKARNCQIMIPLNQKASQNIKKSFEVVHSDSKIYWTLTDTIWNSSTIITLLKMYNNRFFMQIKYFMILQSMVWVVTRNFPRVLLMSNLLLHNLPCYETSLLHIRISIWERTELFFPWNNCSITS